MGTGCLTKIHDGGLKDQVIAVLYRQCDGYPEGHGIELERFLKDKKVVNGISHDDKEKGNFNGPGCLAASIVAHFKKEIGGFYLCPTNSKDWDERYIYHVYVKDGKPLVRMEVEG